LTTLILLIPFGADLALLAGSADRKPGDYRKMWMRARDEISALPTEARSGIDVHLEHASTQTDGYTAFGTSAFAKLNHLITLDIDPERFVVEQRPSSFESVDKVQVQVYPHQLGFVEISISLCKPPDAGEGLDAWLDLLQKEGVAFGEWITAKISSEIIIPIIGALRAADRKSAFFLAPYRGSLEMGAAVWVSRVMLVAPEDRSLLSHWTKDVVGGDSESLRDDLLNGSRNSLVRWVNYAFVDEDHEGAISLISGAHSAEFSALRIGQVLWPSLERVDTQLKLVLSDAAAANTRWKLELLQEDLSHLSTRAELIVMERQELQKFMPRRVREHYEKILAAWEYDSLIEQPVLFKIELCNRRLSELSAKRTARSSLVTDLILLGIGVTSIAGVALGITSFGRQAAADPLSTGYDLGRSDLINWFSGQPIDLILVASGAVSVILVALYLYFRSDNRG
jgi:hypothetical protein